MSVRTLPPRRPETNHEAFADASAPDTQFWLGLLASDGCVRIARSRRGYEQKVTQLRLSNKDAETVEAFGEFCGARVRPAEGNNTLCSVYSGRIFDRLGEFGIVPRKTATLDVPDWLVESRHFMRGFVCGDGSVGWTRRRKKEMQPCLSVSGSSPAMMDKILAAWQQVIPDCKLSLHKSVSNSGGMLACGRRIRMTLPHYRLTVYGWSHSPLLINWLFAPSFPQATMPRKQNVADIILAADAERQAVNADLRDRHAAGERVSDIALATGMTWQSVRSRIRERTEGCGVG